MNRMFRIGSVVLLTATVAVACGKRSASPVSPSGTEQSGAAATANAGLKATAPTPQSPTNGQKPTGALVLIASASTLPFSPVQLPLTYRFEILSPIGQNVYTSLDIAAGSGTTISDSPNAQLVVDQTYQWRVRAEFEGAVGPWSTLATFVANRPKAFINATTLWDPLDNGETIGTINGPHTWIPGVGLRLDAFESHVVYELPDGGRIEEGEFSAIISNAPANTEGIKTKVFAMSSGFSDLTTNPARMTVEKRGDAPTGGVAWRFLTTGEGVETIGRERELFTDFNDGPYFWQATWRNRVFRVAVFEGGVNGPDVYDLAKEYDGFYNPVPHVIWLGSQHSRSGPENWTVPGMIIRKVWVSWDPRPSFAN